MRSDLWTRPKLYQQYQRIVAEEKLLVTMYPEYGAYARVTKRLVPFVL